MKRLLISALLLINGVVISSVQNVHAQASVGIPAPDASAMFQVESTSKGALLPRMTAVQRTAIAAPANGLLVYQTDDTQSLYMNIGTSGSPSWVSMLHSGSSLPAANITGTIATAQIADAAVTAAKVSSTGASSGQVLTYNGTSVAWATPTITSFPFLIVQAVKNGTFTYTIPTSVLGGYLFWDAMQTNTTASVDFTLPSPAAAGNGARFKLAYLNFATGGMIGTIQARTPSGTFYGGNGVVAANTYISIGATSEFICDGTNWYEIFGL